MAAERELPVGFAMSLAMDAEAMQYYASLPQGKQEEIINYVSQPSVGTEGRTRIDEMVNSLHNHSADPHMGRDSYF